MMWRRLIRFWEALLRQDVLSVCATVDQKLLLNLVTSHSCCESMSNAFHF